MKKVDITIPVYNRLEHTKQTLQSLFKNTDPEMYNLYVVDDCSTDGTREWLERNSEHFDLFLNKENIGPAATRNFICDWITRYSDKSKYLYLSDNDVYFTEGWLEKLIQAYEEIEMLRGLSDYPEVLLLGGGCHPYLKNNSRIDVKGVEYLGQIKFSVGLKDAVSGYSQLMTWDTWDKYGHLDTVGKDQEIKIMGSEDWAMCQRIIKDGYLVGSLEPEVVIATGKTNSYGALATGHETFKEFDGVKVI